MLFERLVRWVKHGVSDRTGLLSTATALVVDPTMKVDCPNPMSLAEWIKYQHNRPTPSKAVAFLQIGSQGSLATIVDVEKRQLAARVRFETKLLGDFSASFLRTTQLGDSRSILLAPPWLDGTKRGTANAATADEVPRFAAASLKSDDGGMSTQGVVAPGERPPQSPRVQALVTLAEETATIQTLPIITGQPLEA